MNASDAPKRFYKEAGLFEDAAGFGVALDGRPIKTPAARDFRVPTRALAKACAAEWSAQAERILSATMPLTTLANAALDHTAQNRDVVIAEIAKYIETDLVSHRAASPATLVARQAATWDPLLAWAGEAYGVRPNVVTGIVASVSDEAVAALRTHAAALDAFRLTALSQATGLAGSAIIALALTQGRVDGAAACAAATLDEHWSFEMWGEDAEARARLDKLAKEFETLGRFVAALTQEDRP